MNVAKWAPPLLVFFAAACHGPSDAHGVTDLDGHPADPLAKGSPRVSVLVFVSTDCPLSNRYAPELEHLFERYAARGAAFHLVYPTREESADAVRAHAREYGLRADVIRDPEHALVVRAKATVTPEAAVFVDGALTYHGRIDDRAPALGVTRDEPTRHDLADVLDDVLAGRRARETVGPAIGCAIEGAN